MNRAIYIPYLMRSEKIRPLAETLVMAAAEQGATLTELRVAAQMAVEAYEEAMDRSKRPVTEFQSDAKTALDSL